MTDIVFTSKDFYGLINTLSDMAKAGKLPDGQWALLLSIFAAAGGRVEISEAEPRGKFSGVKVNGGEVIEDPKNKDVKILREQLHKAYIPGRRKPSIGSMVEPPQHQPGH